MGARLPARGELSILVPQLKQEHVGKSPEII